MCPDQFIHRLPHSMNRIDLEGKVDGMPNGMVELLLLLALDAARNIRPGGGMLEDPVISGGVVISGV